MADQISSCGGYCQSPIDLMSPDKCESDAERELPLVFQGSSAGFHLNQHDDVFKGEVLLNGTGTVAPTGTMPFSLLHFHIHAPSEHTLDGKHYDAEAHLSTRAKKKEGVETSKWIQDVVAPPR